MKTKPMSCSLVMLFSVLVVLTNMARANQDSPVDVYSGGLLRSLRSSPQTKIIPAMRTHPSVGLYNGGLLRSLRSGASGDPYERGLLRSLRSAPAHSEYLKW